MKCRLCLEDTLVVDGCADVAYVQAYRYGTEPWFVNGELEPLDRCVTCGARIGFHHHADCTYAKCRECGDQAVFCAHNILDDPAETRAASE